MILIGETENMMAVFIRSPSREIAYHSLSQGLSIIRVGLQVVSRAAGCGVMLKKEVSDFE
jgi:hypothetical protein